MLPPPPFAGGRQAAAAGLVEGLGRWAQGLVGKGAHDDAIGRDGRGGSVVQVDFEGHPTDSGGSKRKSDPMNRCTEPFRYYQYNRGSVDRPVGEGGRNCRQRQTGPNLKSISPPKTRPPKARPS